MKMYDHIVSTTPKLAQAKKAVVSLSGGLDSTTLLYLLVNQLGRANVHALSFDYNQRHSIELVQAKKTCTRLGVKQKIIDISFMGEMAADVSAMVKGDVETPTMDDVKDDPQPATYMPNRNMILLSIAAGFAECIGADTIALGIQKIDSYGYWDTTPEFYEAAESLLSLNRKSPITFAAPFLNLTKVEEIALGLEIGVHFEETWTCYNPVAIEKDGSTLYTPCSNCPSCHERSKAFARAKATDTLLTEQLIISQKKE